MRILSGAVIVSVALVAGCSGRDDTVQTPSGQAPAAQAPAPAGGAAGGAQAAGAAAGASVTIAQHEATMKQIAQTNGALQKSIKSNDLPGAADQAQTLAGHFATVEQFWSQRNKPDAVKLAQTGRQGATDAAAAAKAGDQMKAQMAAGNVGGTCTPCHGTYREGDAQTGFRIAASAGITQ